MRKDSQGICFLGKINYNDFIERYLGKRVGKIVELETGKVLGKHNGYWFHTIGQRKGLSTERQSVVRHQEGYQTQHHLRLQRLRPGNAIREDNQPAWFRLHHRRSVGRIYR